MSRKSRRAKRDKQVMKYRAKVIQAAATAFTNPIYGVSDTHNKTEELWALCVFFEQFIAFGGDGTMKNFGPPHEDAKILKMVRPE